MLYLVQVRFDTHLRNQERSTVDKKSKVRRLWCKTVAWFCWPHKMAIMALTESSFILSGDWQDKAWMNV